jgi:hypothetical protein
MASIVMLMGWRILYKYIINKYSYTSFKD